MIVENVQISTVKLDFKLIQQSPAILKLAIHLLNSHMVKHGLSSINPPFTLVISNLNVHQVVGLMTSVW